MMLNIRIHGDNIVECERAWILIKNALFDSEKIVLSPLGSILSPIYEVKTEKLGQVKVQFFPGFGRWSPDILNYIRTRGGMLREASDAIICLLSEDDSGKVIENPVLAIEFCGALPAGNQAWQRCGRGYSFAAAGIPYLYIAEIGGFELSAQRKEKALRLPNPIVPFCYITFSLIFSTPALPFFVPSPSIRPEDMNIFTGCFGKEDLIAFIRNTILGKNLTHIKSSIFLRTIKFVNILSSNRKSKDTFTEPTWEEWLKCIREGKDAIAFICNKKLPWSKTAYITGLTGSAKNFIQEASRYGIGIGSSNIPICLIPRSERTNFSNSLIHQYPILPKHFKEWLFTNNDLAICWIMGFKPRGDDARPDRGLPPLARMIVGPKVDIMSFVYGPAKKYMWGLLNDNPGLLAEKNGLWESIMAISDAILIDSSTDQGITKKGYVRTHWNSYFSDTTSKPMPAVDSWPTTIGENDVDTIIHNLLSFEENTSIFEGMCNPPGGDWSGISIMYNGTHRLELRWVSLPRVSASGTKRPDHVFQFLREKEKSIILSIESKKDAHSIESGIGPRLTKYIRELLSSPASVERNIKSGSWKRSNRSINFSDFRFASAAAFLIVENPNIRAIVDRAGVDLVFGVELERKDMSTKISISANSTIGSEILSIIKGLPSVKTIPLKINAV